MSWSLFYEDDSGTWANAVADACTTIVNYGVEIPWCVCNTSSSLITTITEYMTYAVLTTSVAIGLDKFWSVEWTVALICLLLQAPMIYGRTQGNLYFLATQLMNLFTGLAWMGCFLEVAAGIQGGVVFGGQLFYPSLFLLGLAMAGAGHCFDFLNYEVFGLSQVENKDQKIARPLEFCRRAMVLEAVTCYAFATFGFPKIENDPEVLPWLSTFPILAMVRISTAYFEQDPRLQKAGNGEIQNKSQTTADVEPAKSEAAKEEASTEKKDDTKKDETPAKPAEGETAVAKTSLVNTLKNAAGRLCCAVVGLFKTLLNMVLCAYNKVQSLPWALISNLVIALGMQVTYTLIFWTLTEDCAAFALPVMFYVIPLVIKRFSDRFSKANAQLFQEVATFTGICVKYYLFKTNISQAY